MEKKMLKKGANSLLLKDTLSRRHSTTYLGANIFLESVIVSKYFIIIWLN